MYEQYITVSFLVLGDSTKCGPGAISQSALARKPGRKSTYPPPADGVRVLFLCKPRCSANEPAAQAGRDALRVTGSFTDCKVLKRSAGRLHSGAAGDHERGRAGGPDFIDRTREKHRNTGIFRNEIDLFFRRPWLSSMRSKAGISHETCGSRRAWGTSQFVSFP